MKISNSQYIKFLKILVSLMLVLDAVYGLILGSSTSLIRCLGHIGLIVLLMIEHKDLRFAINLWAIVLLILVPMIYPGIAAMYFISGNPSAIDTHKLFVKLGWILMGFAILWINNSKKITITK